MLVAWEPMAARGHVCHDLGGPVNKATPKKSRGEKWTGLLMLSEPLIQAHLKPVFSQNPINPLFFFSLMPV